MNENIIGAPKIRKIAHFSSIMIAIFDFSLLLLIKLSLLILFCFFSWSKNVNSDNFCYLKNGRSITLSRSNRIKSNIGKLKMCTKNWFAFGVHQYYFRLELKMNLNESYHEQKRIQKKNIILTGGRRII